MGEAAGQNTELTMLERVGLFTLLVTTENITALRQTMGVPSREHEMQLNHLSAERKHARGWDHLPQSEPHHLPVPTDTDASCAAQGREGFEVGRTVYTLQPSSSYHPQDVSLLPPPKRHQVSPAMLGSTSTSLPPSLRQSALPSMTAADQQRMDQNVAILLNAQSGSHLGNVPL